MDLYTKFKDRIFPHSTLHQHKTRVDGEGLPVIRIAHNDKQRSLNIKADYVLVPRPPVTSIDEKPKARKTRAKS